MTDDQLFINNKPNPLLAQMDGLYLSRKGQAYPIDWVASDVPHWRIKAREKLNVVGTSPETLEEALWRLDSSFNAANMRLVSFSSETNSMPSQVQAVVAKGVPELTEINPDGIENSFNILRNQTLMITGKQVDGILQVQGKKGKVSSLKLEQLQQYADKYNINLVIIETKSAKQLGSTSLPWREEFNTSQLEKAFATNTYGDFLSALGKKEQHLTFGLEDVKGNFASFRAVPDSGSVQTKGSVQTNSAPDLRLHFAIHSARLLTHTKEHQLELDSRIIPGVSSALTMFFIVNFIAGIVVITFSITVWRKIWKLKPAKEYSSWIFLVLSRVMRFFLFTFVFLGMFGTLLLIVRALQIIFRIFRAVWHVLTWPYRLITR